MTIDEHQTAPAPDAVVEGRPRRIVAIAGAGLLLLSLVATAVLGWKVHEIDGKLDDSRAQTRSGAAAVTEAKAFAVLVSTYSPSTLDQTFVKVLDQTTGEFRTQYQSASSALRKSIVSLKGSSTGVVHQAGLVSLTGKEAKVVVFLDQTVKNSGLESPRTDRSRVLLTLVRERGSWLVSALELV